MDALEAIFTRRSIRKFTSAPVSPEDVRTLLEAAMSAPTAAGVQPWRFIVLTDRAVLDAVPSVHRAANMIRQAPLAILVCGDTTSEQYGGYWVQDCSAVMQNILLAARALGLGSCWCGIHSRPEREEGARKLFNLPAEISPLGLAVIGHPAEPFTAKERYDENKVRYNVWS